MIVVASLSACSASSAPAGAPLIVESDAGTNGPAAEVPYPAVRASMPAMQSSGGPVLTAPKIVPVFFPGDADQARIEAFLHALPGSDYWKTVTAPYGIGATSIESSRVAAEPAPGNVGDADIQKWLASHLGGASPAFGAPDSHAIYTLFVPAATSFSVEGAVSCKDLGGYHGFTKIGGVGVAYAVVGRCPHLAGLDGLDVVTAGASHELIEAAANPSFYDAPAYGAVDDDHAAWSIEPGAEVADLCDRFSGVYVKPTDLGFVVERVWSNESAAAGHHPCVPTIAGEPYFNVVPALGEDVALTLGPSKTKTKGLKVPVGTERTVDVTFVSDMPTDEWEVRAEVVLERKATLELSWEGKAVARGKNGDVARLTIKAIARGTFGGSIIKLTSTQGDRKTFWVGYVES